MGKGGVKRYGNYYFNWGLVPHLIWRPYENGRSRNEVNFGISKIFCNFATNKTFNSY